MSLMGSARRRLDRFLRGPWVDETPCLPAVRGAEFAGTWLDTPVGRQVVIFDHHQEARAA